MIFLTDGRTYLGPYDAEGEPLAIARGVRWLREVERSPEVHRIEAADDMAARRAYGRAMRKR